MLRGLMLIVICASALFAEAAGQSEIASASLNSSGAVLISYADGSELLPPKLPDQVSFGRPIVAKDKKTAGWLAMFPNCCTSYPIPLALVIYRNGKMLASIAPGRAISHWIFLSAGSRVALCTDVLHGESYPEYELHGAKDGRLIASWNPSSAQKQPEWVGLLESDNSNDQ